MLGPKVAVCGKLANLDRFFRCALCIRVLCDRRGYFEAALVIQNWLLEMVPKNFWVLIRKEQVFSIFLEVSKD